MDFKHITTRLAENAAAVQARENKERKQRLMVLIEGKENEQLGAKPLEELRAILATL